MADENILKRIRDALNRAGLVVPSDTVRQIVGMVLEAAARQETPTADDQALASQYTDRAGQDQRASAGGACRPASSVCQTRFLNSSWTI